MDKPNARERMLHKPNSWYAVTGEGPGSTHRRAIETLSTCLAETVDKPPPGHRKLPMIANELKYPEWQAPVQGVILEFASGCSACETPRSKSAIDPGPCHAFCGPNPNATAEIPYFGATFTSGCSHTSA
jgi:hypothetical protein